MDASSATPPTPPAPGSTPSAPINPPPPPGPPARRVRVALRDLFIFVIALIAGVISEELLRRSGMPLGQAIVAAGATFAGTFYFLERIVE